MLYFDHNSTYPLCAEAREAWLRATEEFIGNPSSPHRLGARAAAALDGARETVARYLGCKPEEIVWTSGATEAINTAVAHLAATRAGEALVSAIEHPAVLAAVERYFAGRYRVIPALASGVVDLQWLEAMLGKVDTPMVSLMAANNETGALQPWREVLTLCKGRGVPYLCDAAQWIGKLPSDGLGECDFAVGCAHKFGGPQGTGFLKYNVENGLQSLLVGGGQEEGHRAGTENVAGILSMVAGLETRARGMASGVEGTTGPAKEKVGSASFESDVVAKHRTLRADFCGRLAQAVPGVAFTLPSEAEALWNTVSVIMPEADDCRQRWVVKLDALGVAVSTGSACASGKEKPSHVLRAMGIPAEEAGRVLRFSSGWETTAEDWDRLLEKLVLADQALRRSRA